MVIDHGNGWQSAYGELARATVKPGDAIKAGERLGIAGAGKDGDKDESQGGGKQPEFHFSIRHDKDLVDPTPLLRLGG